MPTIEINDLVLNANITSDTTSVSEPTGAELRAITFEGRIFGEAALNRYTHYSGAAVDFTLVDTATSFRARFANVSYSYSELNESSPIEISFTITEVDPALPEDHNLTAATNVMVIQNRIRLRTITQLLIDAGIFTDEQFTAALLRHMQVETDTQEFRNQILFGLYPPEPTVEDGTEE